MTDTCNEATREATRCLLIPNPARFFSDSFFGMYTNVFRLQSTADPLPRLAMDVGKDAIRVTDLVSNALVASTSLSGVHARPGNHVFRTRGGRSTEPVLVAYVPGMQPLTIGAACEPGTLKYSWSGGYEYPYEWRGEVPRETPATYLVSSADWSMLVEKFGLGPQLKRHDHGWQSSAAAPHPTDGYTSPEYVRGLQRYSRVMWWMVGISLVWCLIILAVVLGIAFIR